MKVNEAFPSNYLEALDLDGKEVTVEIESVEDQHKGTGTDGKSFIRPLLKFKGKKKGMVLNKTNAKRIAVSLGYGNEMQNWAGKTITIYPTKCNAFGKKNTPCVRVLVQEDME